LYSKSIFKQGKRRLTRSLLSEPIARSSLIAQFFISIGNG